MITVCVAPGCHKDQKNGNLEMKKEKTNFWDEVPKMSAQEKRLQIEDLGYDPLEQRPKGRERVEE